MREDNRDVVVLKCALAQILLSGQTYRVFIRLSKGAWIEHSPFEASQRGLAGALTLAADVCAGKFYPMRVALPIDMDADFQKELPKMLRGSTDDAT